MTWVAAAVSVATAVGGAVYSSSQASKARRMNSSMLNAADASGAFDPLAIPRPVELKVPPAEQILASWRNEVNNQFPEYDRIAGKLNTSEQNAARYANQLANPQYYNTLNQITSNAMQASRGNIPQDVNDTILRRANEDAYLKGFSYGSPGGKGGGNVYAGGNDAAANLGLRNLGLTSLDMMKYGDALSQGVLEQSRASRGRVTSAQDVTPTPEIFQSQMNAAAVAKYNFAQGKENYSAASANAPIQAAYNKLALQMGVQSQNSALSAQTSASNTQLALSALQALGQSYGGSSTIGKSNPQTGGNYGYSGGVASGYNAGQGGYLNTDYNFGSDYFGNPYNAVQPVSSASSITAVG